MQSIAKDIYIEDQYPGVTLGAVNLPRGLLQIDSPPSPDDGRAWRATLLNLGGSAERLLVNLDAHPDRTLGARVMDCTVAAHEKTALVFRNRSNTFKAQGEETGAEWEKISNLGSVRWVPPELSFSERMVIHWDATPALLEHHPGPTAGALWVVLPEARVVFVGDAVMKNQPPFLAHADIPAWLDAIGLLLSSEYRNWLVVSGRGGVSSVDAIRHQKDFLEHALSRMEKLAARGGGPEAVEGLVAPLLGGFKAPAARQGQYAQRLRYGLNRYFIRHYRPSSLSSEEE